MRSFAAAIASIAIGGAIVAPACLGAASAQTYEPNQARPGGVYLQSAAPTPQACARACENDSLCMAWTHNPNAAQSCELKAVIPPAKHLQDVVSGLSSRAPRLMRLVSPAPAPAPPSDIAAIESAEALRASSQMRDQKIEADEAVQAMEEQPDQQTVASVSESVPSVSETPATPQTENAIAEAHATADDLGAVAATETASEQMMSVRLGEPINPSTPSPPAANTVPAQAAATEAQTTRPPAQTARRPPALRSGR